MIVVKNRVRPYLFMLFLWHFYSIFIDIQTKIYKNRHLFKPNIYKQSLVTAILKNKT